MLHGIRCFFLLGVHRPVAGMKKELPRSTALVFGMERAMGVEPPSKAWEAFILPMNYAREHYEIHCTMKIQEVKSEDADAGDFSCRV